MEKQRMLLLCDLPLEKRNQRKEARIFRELLFKEGFFELQPGVYSRMVESRSSRDIHVKRIKASLPPYGRVRLIMLTENQFQNAPLLCGEETKQSIISSELDIFI